MNGYYSPRNVSASHNQRIKPVKAPWALLITAKMLCNCNLHLISKWTEELHTLSNYQSALFVIPVKTPFQTKSSPSRATIMYLWLRICYFPIWIWWWNRTSNYYEWRFNQHFRFFFHVQHRSFVRNTYQSHNHFVF